MVDAAVDALDASMFQELRDSLISRPEALTNVYRTFFDSAAKLIGALRDQEDGAARVKALHALKGSAAMVGASRVAALAERLQNDSPHTAALTEAIEELERELRTFRQIVAARLESPD